MVLGAAWAWYFFKGSQWDSSMPWFETCSLWHSTGQEQREGKREKVRQNLKGSI